MTARLARAGAAVALVLSAPPARAQSAPAQPDPRYVEVVVGVRAGTGYGSSTGHGEVDVEHRFSGWSRAATAQIVPEVGVLLPRWHVMFSSEIRYQLVGGTTEVVAATNTSHTPRSAAALLSQVTVFPRAPGGRLQPYVAVGAGYGTIRHLAPLQSVSDCGPNRNQRCVDTIVQGSYQATASGGLRIGIAGPVEAVAAIDAQLGAPNQGLNFDAALGLALRI